MLPDLWHLGFSDGQMSFCMNILGFSGRLLPVLKANGKAFLGELSRWIWKSFKKSWVLFTTAPKQEPWTSQKWHLHIKKTYLGTQMRSLTARTFTACRCWLNVSPSMGARSGSDLSEVTVGLFGSS